MVRVRVVAEGLCAGPAALALLSPDVADIVGVMRLRNLEVLLVCIGGAKRIPTVAIYNRYKVQPDVIDRQSVAT
ncbi:hypothetical protein [Bradyrhizobium sp. LMG 9283]|uniref:hypothetical protein n=1 Tax=Bradyrhizobium sp. LMG 9283 TaxID=592064 RepID=UPI0038903099